IIETECNIATRDTSKEEIKLLFLIFIYTSIAAQDSRNEKIKALLEFKKRISTGPLRRLLNETEKEAQCRRVRMGKAGKQSLFVKLLRRRVQDTYGSSSNPSIKELVEGLRAKYPEYARHKPQLLTRIINQTLHPHNNNNNKGKRKLSRNKDEDDITSCKKAKKIDIKEQIDLQSESPSSDEDDGDEDISAVATSEVEVYSPQFDLTKSMLRNKYNEKPNKSVELEMVTHNTSKKIDLGMEVDKFDKPATPQVSTNNSPNDDDALGRKVKQPRFKDLGGMDGLLRDLLMDVIIPFYHPDLPLNLGVTPTAGILLHGPPGCGKTTLAYAIANEAGVPFYKIAATEFVSGVSGDSEEKMRELFANAHKTAPSIVFIDEIDAIASKRDNLQRGMEQRIVTQLMICMDATTSNAAHGTPGYVLVIGATNRPDALDPALRRPGRFDHEITLPVPDENARRKILGVLTRNVKLEGAFDAVKISKLTPGFVGADLKSLVDEAGRVSMRRFFKATELELSKDTQQLDEDWWQTAWTPEEKASNSITMSDFEEAAKLVQPSTKRTGFSSIPDVKWEDIGGLDWLRRKFYTYIVDRIKDPLVYQVKIEKNKNIEAVSVKLNKRVKESSRHHLQSSFPNPALISIFLLQTSLLFFIIFTGTPISCTESRSGANPEHVRTAIRYGRPRSKIVAPLANYVTMTNGLNFETGFLLHGPPGCGKSLIAKAVANEAGANFIHVKGPELLDKYVGESELKVRTMFSRARTCSPCILFFDEVDAWTSQRGKEGGWVVERLLTQASKFYNSIILLIMLILLIELDGGDPRNGVYVIGATNRPEAMDSALLRPGRFGEVIYVPLPNQDERGMILKALSKNYSLDVDVDLIAIARKKACENLSGADLKILNRQQVMMIRNAIKLMLFEMRIRCVRGLASQTQQHEPLQITKAADCAYKEKISKIKTVHFEKALTEVSPSISDKQRKLRLAGAVVGQGRFDPPESASYQNNERVIGLELEQKIIAAQDSRNEKIKALLEFKKRISTGPLRRVESWNHINQGAPQRNEKEAQCRRVRMGKSGKQSSLFVKLLRRRVQDTYGSSSNPSIKELVEGIRAKYPEYARHKPQLLTRIINQTLHPHNNKGKRKLSRNNHEDDITSCKKAKKIDIREHIEESPSSSDDDDEDISSAVVATSEVEMYSHYPQFDLTKSMLRNKYNEKPNKSVELEMVTHNTSKKIDLGMEVDKFDKPATPQVSTNNLPNDDDALGRKVKQPRFKDLGGMDDLLRDLLMDVIIPFYHPDLPLNLGVTPTAGILLHGPPGCGKTTLAYAIANEAGVPFYKIAATEFVSGVSGDSEEKMRELFANAHKTAPSIVFIDEIDAIASKRDNLQRGMEQRIVTQLMICMDATTSNAAHGTPGYVLVIGATNRPDALDPALRRPGRFDHEITLPVPDENARTKILHVLTRNVKLEGAFDAVKISKLTPGFVGADLKSLVNEAGKVSMRRFFMATELELSKDTQQLDEDWWQTAWTPEEKASNSITMSDFEEAAKLVQPSTKRTGFSSIPDVKWEDIGGLDWLRRKFYTYIVDRIKDPLVYQLLTELDGGDPRNGVYVIGATNRPEAMDSALLRPGRFGEVIYVPLPNQDERGLILKALSKNYSLDADVDLIAIARKKACENLSGADLKILNRQQVMMIRNAIKLMLLRCEYITKAADCAYKEKISKIKTVHFEKALTEVSPSISDKQRQRYDRIAKSLKS
ncbi:hypothetical protein M8C21_015956, partial [Ambrosia artemisiifolia]